jgi:hypothetical protein
MLNARHLLGVIAIALVVVCIACSGGAPDTSRTRPNPPYQPAPAISELPSTERSAPVAPATAVPLPRHEVASNTSLAPKQGRRIEIHSADANLTHEQCRALIEHYRDQGAPDGQVSVHKPSKLLKGELAPWCVENFEGEGIEFNESLFER